MTNSQLQQLFSEYWEQKPRNHKKVPAAPLVLANDATTLFTSSGMQPLVPYLMGQTHPLGTRLYDIQPSIRTQDIEEVGDNRHTTFFYMMGNWSLNDYFKKDQLIWMWEFFTIVLKLPKDRLHVTIFEGSSEVPKDSESYALWQQIGVAEDHIHAYNATKNWWSRSGPPEKMPEGEIGGPDSEVFYDFGTPHDPAFGSTCHPNCDCGRFMEIGNSVFIQYIKRNGKLEELPQKNVDFGGGLERVLAAVNNNPDMFATDVFAATIEQIEKAVGVSYKNHQGQAAIRVIADHMRAAVHLINDGVRPSNKEHGYVLRRLLRRSAVKMWQLGGGLTPRFDEIIDKGVLHEAASTGAIDRNKMKAEILSVVEQEIKRFGAGMDRGLKIIEKAEYIDGKVAFDLYQSYGFPYEVTEELATQKKIILNKADFDAELLAHKQLSKTTSAGKFKGGLADQSDQVVKYHTATHLLHKALQDVYGEIIRQEGSNITQDRLRFDTRLDHKPTAEEIHKIEAIINAKIDEALPVYPLIMSKAESEKLGASAFFKEKYADTVQVYCIGASPSDPGMAYSKELCGGPHVKNTKEIGHITLKKVEKIGTELVRFYLE